MQTTLVIGATSAIGRQCARTFAGRGDRLFLAARNEAALKALADDCSVRGAASTKVFSFDAEAFDADTFVDQLLESAGRLDRALICHGTLPDQAECEQSTRETGRQLAINGLSVISLLTPLANHMQGNGAGTLAVITSVAGDRGRQSNYVYGAAKGMVSLFLAGLRNRLYGHGVRVVDIRPGFVDTPMTEDFPKGPLWATPERVASDIVRAMDKGKAVCYTPFFWRWIMLIIRSIPERVFIRMKL